MRETPGDDEVQRALLEAQAQLKKQTGEDAKDMKTEGEGNMFVVSGKNQCGYLPSSHSLHEWSN